MSVIQKSNSYSPSASYIGLAAKVPTTCDQCRGSAYPTSSPSVPYCIVSPTIRSHLRRCHSRSSTLLQALSGSMSSKCRGIERAPIMAQFIKDLEEPYNTI